MPVHYTLNDILFEWDARKAAANRRKHGIDFEEACEVFFDPFLRAADGGAEGGELREAVLGMTRDWRLLFVVYVERDESFRLISARPVTRVERRFYEDQ